MIICIIKVGTRQKRIISFINKSDFYFAVQDNTDLIVLHKLLDQYNVDLVLQAPKNRKNRREKFGG